MKSDAAVQYGSSLGVDGHLDRPAWPVGLQKGAHHHRIVLRHSPQDRGELPSFVHWGDGLQPILQGSINLKSHP